MKFPDFIIIGAAKCGTTPLWFNIDKHPDITMAPRRPGKTEMYFWGTKNYKLKGIEWYKGKFSGKVRKKLIEYFKPFNQKLYEFLGYKIDEWER